MVHREPCCWKWHSSSNQRSILGFWAKRWSFFICPLHSRVTMSNQRTRFPSAEPHLRKKALTLPNAKINFIAFSEMVAQEFTIPKILGVFQLPGRSPQIASKLVPEGRVQGRRTSRSWHLPQVRKILSFQIVAPNTQRCAGCDRTVRRQSYNYSQKIPSRLHEADDRSAIPPIVRSPAEWQSA